MAVYAMPVCDDEFLDARHFDDGLRVIVIVALGYVEKEPILASLYVSDLINALAIALRSLHL